MRNESKTTCIRNNQDTYDKFANDTIFIPKRAEGQLLDQELSMITAPLATTFIKTVGICKAPRMNSQIVIKAISSVLTLRTSLSQCMQGRLVPRNRLYMAQDHK